MIRVNATTIYMVILCMMGFSLRAIEPTEKLSIDEAIIREYFRMQEAIALQQLFRFDQDLIDIVGFGELMERFFPVEIWDTGVLLPRNIEFPRIPFSRRQVGPEVDFESLRPAPDLIVSPQADADSAALGYDSSDDVEGLLNNIFDEMNPQSSTVVPSPARAANEQTRTSRRSLLSELTAGPIPQQNSQVSGSSGPDVDGLLADFTSFNGQPRTNVLTGSAALREQLGTAQAGDDLPLGTLVATALQQLSHEGNSLSEMSRDQAADAVVADRILRIIADEPGSSSSSRAASRGSDQRTSFSSVSTPRSGQKRQGDELQTPPHKRARSEKEEVEQEEEFLTPGDLSPIYDLFKPKRTPEDEGGNGGASFQGGLQPTRSVRRLQF